MADNIIKNRTLRTRILQKYDTVENWNTSELILQKGELALDNEGGIKIGTGFDYGKNDERTSIWKNLPYAGGSQIKTYTVENFPDPPTNVETGTLAINPTTGKLNYVVENDDPDNPGETIKSWESVLTQDDIADLASSSDVQAVENKVDTLENVVNGYNTEAVVDDQTGEIITPATYVPGLVDKTEELESSVSDLQADVEALETADNDLLIAIQDNAARISDVESAIGPTSNTDYNEINGSNIVEKLVTVHLKADSAYDDVALIYDKSKGEIKTSVLPSFVDDVIEGFVVTTDINASVYGLTHNNEGAVTGFFTAVDENGAKTLRTSTTTSGYAAITTNANVPASLPESITHDSTVYEFWKTKKLDPEGDAIYVDIFTNNTYRWGGSQFVLIASDLALGRTSGTAFEGSAGKALEDTVNGYTTEPVIDDQTGEIITPATYVPGLVDTVTELENEIATIQSDISGNYATQSALNAEIDTRIADVADLATADTALSSRIDAVNDIIGDLSTTSVSLPQGTVDTVAAEIEAINITTNNNVTNILAHETLLNASETGVIARLDAAEENIAANTSEIQSLGTLIGNLAEKEEADIEDVKGEVTSLVATLQASIDSAISDSSSLVDRVEALEDRADAVDEKLGNVKTDENDQVIDLQTQVDNVEDELVSNTAILQNEINDVSDAVETLAVEVTTQLENKIDITDVLTLDCGGAFDE